MKSASLSVSFWHVGLENIPEGSFVHRRVTPEQAKRLIEEARHADTLLCASHDDLLAPYNEHQRRKHEALCRVLGEHPGIGLSFEDFVVKDTIDGEGSFTIQPLALVEVDGPNRLMIVNCHYVMSNERKRGTLAFDIDPESVTFHLFEAVADAVPPEPETT